MNELFRFVSVRPPHAVPDDKIVDAKALTAGSAFVAALDKAKDQPARAKIAADFRKAGGFVGDPAGLKTRLLDVANAVRDLDDARKVNLTRLIEDAAGAKRRDLIRGKDL